ncbi:F0F1 ATP synthase subunit gamma [Telmatocola sphagniphila]|uniref:F0F1 ATP synthase subunit gamma n=1 Tax=Telmatocola sphagniphila TaxID=1123043 RepID=A0A8E6BAW2_9BACT|nr:F0F1 ATP synthase subunit gamma [Telmatocola sphagniphila]
MDWRSRGRQNNPASRIDPHHLRSSRRRGGFRRGQRAILTARQYREVVVRAISAAGPKVRLLAQEVEADNSLVIVLTSEQPLCGGFNHLVLDRTRSAQRASRSCKSRTYRRWPAGRPCHDGLRINSSANRKGTDFAGRAERGRQGFGELHRSRIYFGKSRRGRSRLYALSVD